VTAFASKAALNSYRIRDAHRPNQSPVLKFLAQDLLQPKMLRVRPDIGFDAYSGDREQSFHAMVNGAWSR